MQNSTQNRKLPNDLSSDMEKKKTFNKIYIPTAYKNAFIVSLMNGVRKIGKLHAKE